MKSLIAQIRQYIFITPELEAILIEAFTRIEVQKTTTLIQEQSYAQQFYFIEKGIVRSFYLRKGNERTYWFYTEHQFFTAWYSFYNQQPSFETIETLEDTILYTISKDGFDRLIHKHPQFERFARLFIEKQYADMDFITKNFLDLTAKEKYDQVCNAMPGLNQRAQLGQIASFLGMSQETLSRLRGSK